MIMENTDVSLDQIPRFPGLADPAQKRAIRVYKVLFTTQLTAAVGIVGCSSLAFLYEQRSEQTVHYYIGGYLIGCVFLFAAALAYCVCRNGPRFHDNEKAKENVICAIYYHRMTSIFVFIVSALGLVILLMFGLCLHDRDECSYNQDETENRAIAIVSLIFAVLGIVPSFVGIVMIRQFGNAFGIDIIQTRTPVPSVSRGVEIRVVNTNKYIADPEKDMRRQCELQLSPFAAFVGIADDVAASAPPQLPPYTPPASSESQQHIGESCSIGRETRSYTVTEENNMKGVAG